MSLTDATLRQGSIEPKERACCRSDSLLFEFDYSREKEDE